jgi:hypothetical protein
MPTSDLRHVLRRLLWLALAAFLAGFAGYMLGNPRVSGRVQAAAYGPAASAPSSEDWNLPKRV